MRVRQLMTPGVETVLSEDTLVVAAHKMRINDIGFLPVLENGAVVGVITDRDIVLRGLGEGLIAELTTVGEIMTPGIVCCYEDDVVTEASKMMEDNHVRRLLVLDEANRFVGLLSLDDLAAHMSSDRLLGTVLRHVTAAR